MLSRTSPRLSKAARLGAAALAALAVSALAGCGSPGEERAASVTVFAAASLTVPFEQIKDEFEREQPGTEIVLNFGGSSGLAQQMIAGAPADVFAAASEKTMDSVGDLTEVPEIFATNSLTIAVPVGNAAGVNSLDDFATPELTIAACAIEVPCGALASTVFAEAGVEPSVDHFAADAEALIGLVELGEVDAALVYRSDIQSRNVEAIDVGVPNFTNYPIAVLRGARYPEQARAFADFVLSERGREILADAGFNDE